MEKLFCVQKELVREILFLAESATDYISAVRASPIFLRSMRPDDPLVQKSKFYRHEPPDTKYPYSVHRYFVAADGKKQGPYKILWNGKLSREMHYTSNLLDGIQKTWYSSGELWIEDIYVLGELKVAKSYLSDGSLISETNYNRGKREGKFRTWYVISRGGGIREEINYKDDSPFGERFVYDEKGHIIYHG
jgi:antitoxin component YwqK of YwqJK toxin-antitoxin module